MTAVMSVWLVSCSTHVLQKHGHQEYGGESLEPVELMTSRSCVVFVVLIIIKKIKIIINSNNSVVPMSEWFIVFSGV